MKTKLVIMIAALGLGVFAVGSPLYAEDMGSAAEPMIVGEGHMGSLEEGMTAETTEGGAIKIGNTFCPISNKKVGEMGDVVEYEYNGKIYNLCCPACLKDFQADPEKYSKMAEDMVAGEEAATE